MKFEVGIEKLEVFVFIRLVEFGEGDIMIGMLESLEKILVDVL